MLWTRTNLSHQIPSTSDSSSKLFLKINTRANRMYTFVLLLLLMYFTVCQCIQTVFPTIIRLHWFLNDLSWLNAHKLCVAFLLVVMSQYVFSFPQNWINSRRFVILYWASFYLKQQLFYTNYHRQIDHS